MTILKKLLPTGLKPLKTVCSFSALGLLSNKVALFFINFYRIYLSNYSKGSCRFHPTCSTYARDAYGKHSFFSASYLVAQRLIKCRPFGPQGFDPLPTRTPHGPK